MTFRQMPDPGNHFIVNPMMNELDQRLVLAHHAECGVSGSCYFACGLDQSPEQRLEICHAHK
jgi:NAD-dependent dihydropyrimidine dehydrogenase PreA subunit